MTCLNCGKALRSKAMVFHSLSILPRSTPLFTAAEVSGKEAVDEFTLLPTQAEELALVCCSVARDDLTKNITVASESEVMIEHKEVMRIMVYTLVGFSSEVTRVAREVGMGRILGGVAHADAIEGV
jgi:hypothetical protein